MVMTATDELRKLLDERGVEWGNIRRDGSESDYLTEWQFDGNEGGAVAIEWAVGSGLNVEIHRYHRTPAQAIEATLGPREQPPYDELIEALRRDWDIEASWDGLRRFWYVGLTDEGVRKRDEREATLGRGECHDCLGEREPFECSECHRRTNDTKWPNYCWYCGAKVVEE